MFIANPSDVSAIHPASVTAIIYTLSVYTSGVTYHIRYAKSNTAPIAIIPPTITNDFLLDELFCPFVEDMLMIH